jgi:hypothetical protein
MYVIETKIPNPHGSCVFKMPVVGGREFWLIKS